MTENEGIAQREPFVSKKDLMDLLCVSYLHELTKSRESGEEMMKTLKLLDALPVCDFWAPDRIDDLVNNASPISISGIYHRNWVSAADRFFMALQTVLNSDCSANRSPPLSAWKYTKDLIDVKNQFMFSDFKDLDVGSEVESSALYRYNDIMKSEKLLQKLYYLLPLYLYLVLGCQSVLETDIANANQG